MTACRNCACEIVCRPVPGSDYPVWVHVPAFRGAAFSRACLRPAPLQNAPDTVMPYQAEPDTDHEARPTAAGCWANPQRVREYGCDPVW